MRSFHTDTLCLKDYLSFLPAGSRHAPPHPTPHTPPPPKPPYLEDGGVVDHSVLPHKCPLARPLVLLKRLN